MLADPKELTSEIIEAEYQEIFTTGHPRSGNTWIGRLLADLLNSPLQSVLGDVIQFHGPGRDGNFVIRKRHSTEVLPGPTVFIYRDPRDVCISKHFYNSHPSIQHSIEEMTKKADNDIDNYGPYEKFVRSMWEHPEKYSISVKYEEIYYTPYQALWVIVDTLTGISLGMDWIMDVYQRQRFSAVLERYPEFYHSMRKGMAGDWENHFSRDDGRMFQEMFGNLMLEQGYIDDGDWWEGLPI